MLIHVGMFISFAKALISKLLSRETRSLPEKKEGSFKEGRLKQKDAENQERWCVEIKTKLVNPVLP